MKSSFVLLAVSFVAGATGNTSVMILYGFAARYKPLYTSALAAGYGLSGLVPSLLTILQNTGAAPVRGLVYSPLLQN